jgi:hypothetical protein
MNVIKNVIELNEILDRTPIVYEGDPLLLAQLDNIRVIKDINSYVELSDKLDQLPNERTIILGPTSNYHNRWPTFRIDKKIPEDIPFFNKKLFDNYDNVREYAFKHTDLSDRIVNNTEVDLIVLVLIDGLSYSDWHSYPFVSSCLAVGPTITSIGFQNIVGNPTIAHRLFDKGFRRRIGFSYWERDNQLTNKIFYGFDNANQMKRVREFNEVLLHLKSLPNDQVYIQILINGLDGISHRYRGRPPTAVLANEIYNNVLIELAETISKLKRSANIYAISDHGILWKPEPEEEKLIIIKNDRVHSKRYAKGVIVSPNTKQFFCYGTNYSILEFPYLFKDMSSIEWGAHGGISFQESIVPFVEMEVF